MKEEGSEGPAAPPQLGGFSSFNAATFFANQAQEKQTQAAELQAAADELLPSSSEEDGNSSESSKPSDSNRKRRHKRDPSRERKSKRSKKKDRSSKQQDRKQTAIDAEFERHVAAELAGGADRRRSQVPSWMGQHATSEAGAVAAGAAAAAFFKDTRGDPGNVAFGGLYRADIARYRRVDPIGFSSMLLNIHKGGGHGGAGRQERSEGAGSRTGAQAGKEARAGGKKNIRRWARRGDPAALRGAPCIIPSSGFLSLDPSKDADAEQEEGRKEAGVVARAGETAAAGAGAAGAPSVMESESEENYLLRRTREFNIRVRESPQDLQLWLDFAAFQDEALRATARRRGGKRAIAEKKISILEAALQHHPGSDKLILALLDEAEEICDDDDMELRWRRVLAHFGGSAALWREYLTRRRTKFSNLSIPEVSDAYKRAAVALSRERMQCIEQHGDDRQSDALVAIECDLVAVLLDGAAFNLQAGHTERGIALLQALLEFNFFAPQGWPEDALEMMFEEFWQSGAPALGERDAHGWGAWLDASAVERVTAQSKEQDTSIKNSIDKVEGKGISASADIPSDSAAQGDKQQSQQQTAWVELAPAIRAKFGHALRSAETEIETIVHEKGEEDDGSIEQAKNHSRQEEEEEKEEEEVVIKDVTEEELLAKLGMDLDAALAQAEQVLTPELMASWITMECTRDAKMWQPQRRGARGVPPTAPENESKGSEDELLEDPLMVVDWEDVSYCAVYIHSMQARDQLLFGCLQLLGAGVRPPSSSPVCNAAIRIADELAVAADWLGLQGGSISSMPEWALLGRTQGFSTREKVWWAADPSRHAFLLNILETFLQGPAKMDTRVALAALDLSAWKFTPSTPPEGDMVAASAPLALDTPQRCLEAGKMRAKQLLAAHSESLVLWAAYAELQRKAGSSKGARKACLACLGSVSAPMDQFTPGLGALTLALCDVELGSNKPTERSDSAQDTLIINDNDSPPVLVFRVQNASPGALAAALRPLLWLGTSGGVSLTAQGPPSEAEVVAARRGYQDGLLRLVRAGRMAFGATQLAFVCAAATCEVLVAALAGKGAGAGIPAALSLYNQVLTALLPLQEESQDGSDPVEPLLPGDCSWALERLEIERCAIAVDAAIHSVTCCPPKLARSLVHGALTRLPANFWLLQLHTRLELSGHNVGALRRDLNRHLAVRTIDSTTTGTGSAIPAWVALFGVEIGTHAPHSSARGVLERALSRLPGQSCPLLWRLYMRLEAGRAEVAHRVFLRAIDACPWAKGVWLDGLTLLHHSGSVSLKGLSEILGVMRDKVAVRTDVLEVVLDAFE